MTDAAERLLAAFETLPANEQHDVLVAMLRIGSKSAESQLTDEHLTRIADESFQLLDAGEAERVEPI